MGRKLRVGVIFGGKSGEHEISLLSAASVMQAIDKDKYEVVPIGITKEGRWLASGDPLKALRAGEARHALPAALLGDPSHKAILQLKEDKHGHSATRLAELDVVFPVLHGPLGEDGTVQGLLELANIPYVGAGVAASALGMDKALMKSIFKVRGLPVAEHLVIKRRDWRANPERVREEIEARLGYPCFVKPANLGSSVGVSKVHSSEELAPALDRAAGYDRKMLAEKAVRMAREIECSVLGNDEPIASVLGEVIPAGEFYDYRSKYIDPVQLIIPAQLEPAKAQEMQELAIRAFLAIDCAGMARVDFLMEREDGVVYINEINTVPGFTAVSMYPKLWEASGLSYPGLIDRLIELALERHADKSANRTSYELEG